MTEYTFTIDHQVDENIEIELEVTYAVTPHYAATYWQPEEGGGVEIIAIKYRGVDYAVTDAEEEAIICLAELRAAEDSEDAAGEYADYIYSQRREAAWFD